MALRGFHLKVIALAAVLFCLLTAASSASAQSTPLLSTSGVGESVTDVFRSTTGHIAICYSTAGQSQGGYLGPSVSFLFETSGPLVDTDIAEQRCVEKNVRPALYYVHVFATDWSAWDLNIYDLP